jgi:GT2 family glycosyltransferase
MNAMASLPLISVVIPTYRRNAELAACLELLTNRQQGVEPNVFEVIVSDDGQDQACRNMLSERFSSVKWVSGPARGPAANRNNGARHAMGQWLAFIDDDCLPMDTWLRYIVEAIGQHPECAVYEGRTRADRPRQSLDEHSPLNEHGGFLWSCNFAISRDLFQRIGGFDERFPFATMEDVDLRYRLDSAGERICFVKDALVIHPYRKLDGWNNLLRYKESMAIYLKLHPEERRFFGPMYYFRAFAYALARDIPFEGARYRWKGCGYAWVRAFMCLYLACAGVFPVVAGLFSRIRRH